MFRIRNKTQKDQAGKEELRCSFCDKAQDDVGRLIAGPEVYICDECVRVCIEIIDEFPSDGAIVQDMPTSGPSPIPCALCGILTPPDRALLVENRGPICPACLDEVQAAVASRDKRDK